MKTGMDHFTFTYDCIAWSRDNYGPSPVYVSTPGKRRPFDPILDMWG